MKIKVFLMGLFPICVYAQSNSQAAVSLKQKETLRPSSVSSIHSSTAPTNSTSQNTYPMTVSSSNSNQQSSPGTSPNLTVEQIDHLIADFQTKIDYVSADSSLKAKAEQDGWFDQMHQTIFELKQKKQLISQ